jgi:hypothetical protein
MFHETNNFKKTSLENIMTASRLDIQEDTKPRNLSPGTIGGPESKPTLESTLMDVKPVNEPSHTKRKPTTHYTPMRSPIHLGEWAIAAHGMYESHQV